MKKILLLGTCLIISALTQAQILQAIGLTDTINGRTTDYELTYHVSIKNISSSNVSVKVYRKALSTLPNTVNYYCWGPNCFPPETSLSTDPVSINPGEEDHSFISYYEPNLKEGNSQIEYCFFNETGGGDSLCFNLNYKTTPPPASILEVSKSNKIGKMFPNPASDLVYLSYNLSTKNAAYLQVFDVVGKQILKFDINSGNDRLVFPVSHLDKGIYFVSLVNGSEVIDTKRLIVNR